MKVGIRFFSLLVLLLVFANYSFAATSPKVFIKHGNVYCLDGKKKIQLTHSGKDRAPVLSPDCKKLVFIRETSKISYTSEDSGVDHPSNADQLWVVGVDGKNEKMLVENKRPNESKMNNEKDDNQITKELEKMIDEIDDNNIKFSPDGKKVYFISSAWVTSGALHVVNLDGSNEHFIASANNLERVVTKGKYKGDLVISQHRYNDKGSYDWYYLFTPAGKEVKALGDDQKNAEQISQKIRE